MIEMMTGSVVYGHDPMLDADLLEVLQKRDEEAAKEKALREAESEPLDKLEDSTENKEMEEYRHHHHYHYRHHRPAHYGQRVGCCCILL